MDNKIYTEQQVRGIVKEGFWDLRCIIRQNVKKQWKKMTKSEQYAAARSLALLNHVAKKPEMYFAPEYTSAQWEARAKEYAKKEGWQDWVLAYYVVEDPTGIVYGDVLKGVAGDASDLNLLYNFSGDVQAWEYSRAFSGQIASANEKRNAKKVIEFRNQIKATLAERERKFLFR